ncbi:hypothetical protein GQ53DRAFT_187051 [Thozetella sp. PMI_491]|nr:hypothetical protein GQ53DRAFT_187051 [Thozetella sp. PMI_491]
MPANNRQHQAAASAQPPASPTTKGTAKYTNKDGSKFITVPKANLSTDSSQASPTLAHPPTSSHDAPHPDDPNGASQMVNRKKQKRRAKAAAKAAAQQNVLEEEPPTGLPSPPISHEQPAGDAEFSDDEPEQYHPNHGQTNGLADPQPMKSKKSKKKKKKQKVGASGDEPPNSPTHHHSLVPPSGPYPPSRGPGISKEKIWNTSSQEERERIKAFWLGLGEDERKSLVKVEKDAVLRKMKEQQKHTCSCTVCGRKRTAIEEELEGLYDAYYQELESYANQPHHDAAQIMGPPRPLVSHGRMHPHSHRSNYNTHRPSQGQIVEDLSENEEDDEEADYSDEELEEEDDYSDEDASEELDRNDYPSDPHDLFGFGNNLQVQGGILTVADDLLKNDGKKFIEMMEQLAERRMAREEDAREQYDRNYSHLNGDRYSSANHAHPLPIDDEDDYDDEDDGEYDDEGDGDYESPGEEDTMTERQRMEEGRRMFQIFAARMFEQRVLTAYREKVAKERQQKLIEEIDDESRLEAQRKAKKAKEAQKRKDKAAKKKEAQAEEKARKEAEKAAEEAARLADEFRKAEEQRLRAEEKRKKKEAAKKAEEEERLRKEADRQRRVHEQKEKQAEVERKAREAKEREKRVKEEARQKEKDAREQKEREARERKERQDQDKRDKEARVKADREAKEKQKQEARAGNKAAAAFAPGPSITLAKRPAPHAVPTAVPALPQQPPASFASPQIPVATPALPKAPTPMRQRQASQQESVSASSQATTQPGSAASQTASPHPLTPVHTSPGPIGPPSKASSAGPPSIPQQASQATSPLAGVAKMAPLPGAFGMPPPMGVPFPPGLPGIPPGFGNPAFQPNMGGFRPAPGMMPMPPGINGPIGGRGFPGHPPPGFSQPLDAPSLAGMSPVFPPGLSKESGPSHSRQPSSGYEPGTPASSSQHIARPAPIGRPPSVVHGQRSASGASGPLGGFARPELEEHLGSSALLDDSDDPLHDFASMRRAAVPPGQRQPPAFPAGPFGHEPLFASAVNPWVPAVSAVSNPFGAVPAPPPGFGGHPLPGAIPWGLPGGGANPGFGGQVPIGRPSQPRSVAVRLMLCRACEEAAAEGAAADDGFIPLEVIKSKVDMFLKGEVPEQEMLILCDTEGNDNNGGGSFDTRSDSSNKTYVRWVPSSGPGGQPFLHRAVGAPGEIGSPKPDRHAGTFGSSR